MSTVQQPTDAALGGTPEYGPGAIPEETSRCGVHGCVADHADPQDNDLHQLFEYRSTPVGPAHTYMSGEFDVSVYTDEEGGVRASIWPQPVADGLSASDLRAAATEYEKIAVEIRNAADVMDAANRRTAWAILGRFSIGDIIEAVDAFDEDWVYLMVESGSDPQMAKRIKAELDRLGKRPLDEDE